MNYIHRVGGMTVNSPTRQKALYEATQAAST
jgi:hypothetical protein